MARMKSSLSEQNNVNNVTNVTLKFLKLTFFEIYIIGQFNKEYENK